MDASVPKISVLIVAYNSGAHLPRCLAALEAQTCRDFEILVLDNGSTDGSAIELGGLTVPARLERSEDNLGFAAGNNRLAAQARGGWFALLNPDAFPEPDWLASFVEATAHYPDVTVFGSMQLLDSDPELLDGAGDHYSPFGLAWRGDRMKPASLVEGDAEVLGPCAAAAFYRRDVFDRVGGFEERFFCYYEDVDLALRLRLAGQRCVQLAKARVRHVASAIAGTHSEFSRYHITRNRVWTFLRCMPAPVFHLLLPLVLAQLALVILLGPLRGDDGVRARAIRDALADFGAVMKQRAGIQAMRATSLGTFLGALTWSPFKLLRAEGDRRPLGGADRTSAAGGTGVKHATD